MAVSWSGVMMEVSVRYSSSWGEVRWGWRRRFRGGACCADGAEGPVGHGRVSIFHHHDVDMRRGCEYGEEGMVIAVSADGD